MSTATKIEWTEATWNPVTGCTKVSAGCTFCYAEAITNRFGGPGAFDKIVLHPERLEKPLHWRKPRTVFVNSMSDLFHADVPREFIARVFAVMAATPRHTFQVLTKRPGRMHAILSDPEWADAVEYEWGLVVGDASVPYPKYPFPNVWLGTSCEDQETADKRIPVLLDTPAAVRFISAEPLLGPVDLRDWLTPLVDIYDRKNGGHGALDWVIVGGESGPSARPMDPEWARSIVRQCCEADVPVFVKQMGKCPTGLLLNDPKGGDMSEWPEDLRVREMPHAPTGAERELARFTAYLQSDMGEA